MSILQPICQLSRQMMPPIVEFTKKTALHPLTLFVTIRLVMGLIHESGHKFAAELMYKKANSKINFAYYILANRCDYEPGKLSHFGKKLGKINAEIFITATGPFIEFACLASLAAFSSKKVAKCLLLISMEQILVMIGGLTFPVGSGDYEELRDYNIYACTALCSTLILATTFIAYRAFRR